LHLLPKGQTIGMDIAMSARVKSLFRHSLRLAPAMPVNPSPASAWGNFYAPERAPP